MGSFSQRMDLKQGGASLQKNTVDPGLRNRLWNRIREQLLKIGVETAWHQSREFRKVAEILWHRNFKRPIDKMPSYASDAFNEIRDHFMRCQWNQVYDFLEDFARAIPRSGRRAFRRGCNEDLAAELAAYRFIDDRIVPLTEGETAALEEALSISGPLQPASVHLRQALNLIADRTSPDYRNSIKESISAVEAVCKLLTGEDKATLGRALNVLDKKLRLHAALKQAFQNLYSYTSDANGIRHALLEEADLTQDDAKFMLVACSAFVNYLVVLAAKAGIKL